jgi:hypothetical protein
MNNKSTFPFDEKSTLEWINTVENKISNVYEEFNGNVPKSSKRLMFSIAHYKDQVRSQLTSPSFDPEALSKALTDLGSRSIELRASIDSDDIISEAAMAAIDDLKFTIFNQASRMLDLLGPAREVEKNSSKRDVGKLSDALQILRQQLNNLQNDNNRSRQAIAKTQKQLEHSDANLSTFEMRMTETLEVSKGKAEIILTELLEKQREINDLVGLLAGETVSGSYAKSANVEKKTADAMRNGSVALMLTIVLIIGYSLFETGQPHFEWETALARLLFSLTLSVPAAYLARESSKHRAQQYTYLRVSLDLQAMPPYLAPLPSEEQNRLRGGIADRIFGAKEQNPVGDSYPLNIQELLMAIINKAEVAKTSKDSKGAKEN